MLKTKTRTEKNRRADNEDSFVCIKAKMDGSDVGVFAVADGVGGLDKGEEASRIAAENVDYWFRNVYPFKAQDTLEMLTSLSDVFNKSHKDIRRYGKDNGINTATTLTVGLVSDGGLVVFHAGDASVYLVRDGKADKVTKVDYRKQIGKTGKMALTNCLGTAIDKFSIDREIVETLQNGDRIFVATDGLVDRIDGSDIAENDLDGLFEIAVREGRKDNMTGIQIDITGLGE